MTFCATHHYEYHSLCPYCMNEKIADKSVKETVNHPSHYNKSSIECIDAIAAAVAELSGEEAFNTGNAIKYLWRWKDKGGIEDLKKARWYIERIINGTDNK